MGEMERQIERRIAIDLEKCPQVIEVKEGTWIAVSKPEKMQPEWLSAAASVLACFWFW